MGFFVKLIGMLLKNREKRPQSYIGSWYVSIVAIEAVGQLP
jgi:hypothetical protein